jgi:hypothetical protein
MLKNERSRWEDADVYILFTVTYEIVDRSIVMETTDLSGRRPICRNYEVQEGPRKRVAPDISLPTCPIF